MIGVMSNAKQRKEDQEISDQGTTAESPQVGDEEIKVRYIGAYRRFIRNIKHPQWVMPGQVIEAPELVHHPLFEEVK